MAEKVRLLSLNVGNPSLERAKRQCEWLEKRQEDIFVLTETKESKGCEYIKEYFGNFVNAPKSRTGDLGVILISKYPMQANVSFFPESSIYFSRQVEAKINLRDKEINVVGLYTPSRDRSEEKILRKKKYIDDMEIYLKESEKMNKIIMGDLNILERTHVPHYSNFFEWEYHFYDAFSEAGYVDAFRLRHSAAREYSWVGRTNDGYRYDYCFVSADLKENILNCRYIHETRDIRQEKRITDHSAIMIEMAV